MRETTVGGEEARNHVKIYGEQNGTRDGHTGENIAGQVVAR